MDSDDMDLELDSATILCKCPICEKRHKVTLQWTGRGTPRINCDWCKRNVIPFAGDLEGDHGRMIGIGRRQYALGKDYNAQEPVVQRY